MVESDSSLAEVRSQARQSNFTLSISTLDWLAEKTGCKPSKKSASPASSRTSGESSKSSLKSVDAVLRRYKAQLAEKEHIYFKPNIPGNKLQNAYKAYVSDSRFPSVVKAEDILVLWDDTVFGSAKDGFCLTTTHLYVHEMWTTPWCLILKNIKSKNIEVVAGEDENLSLQITAILQGEENTIPLGLSLLKGNTLKSVASMLQDWCTVLGK